MRTAFAIDPDQRLPEADELDLVRLSADLGYVSAWTPARADAAAFERCLRWHNASGLAVGISAVPAAGQPPEYYAEQARRAWEGTGGQFTLAIGSGSMAHAAAGMRAYLAGLRRLVPPEMPLFVAALGPLMLDVAGELADGVALNWCTATQVTWSRHRVEAAARGAGRPTPPLVEYIRTAVDADPARARTTLGAAVQHYALGPAPYRRHFERMGFADELRRVQESRAGVDRDQAGDERDQAPGAAWDPGVLSAVGAWGAPGAVRGQIERLAAGLDVAIVRVLVSQRGDAVSARTVLEECAPRRAP